MEKRLNWLTRIYLGTLLIIFLFITASSCQAQGDEGSPVLRKLYPYFGLYETSDHKNGFMLGMIENYPVLFFPDGNIRGVFDTAGKLMIGNSIGKKDQPEGTLKFEKHKKEMNLIFRKNDGSEINAKRVELNEREISFKTKKIDFIDRDKNDKKDLKLSGSLILPPGEGPFPAIVFTHGSGQETRDASRGLAALFAYNGIACLIFDKRGVGKSEGDHWAASFSDYANDLLAGVQLLKTFPEINKNKIGLYGHSQGGWVVPLAISKSPGDISFAILSAANCVSPLDQHMYNGRRVLTFRGVDSSTIAKVEAFRRNKYAASLGKISKENFYNEILPAAQKQDWLSQQKLTNEELGVDQFFEYNCYYDPLPALISVKCPALVIYGEKDNFTDANLNYRMMQEQFQKNGNRDVTLKMFPDANHAMLYTTRGWFFNREMPALTKFADGYFDLLVNWVKEKTK
ncbi:MAG TPA: alpha/beta fold hydrolase [Chitinophagaceae bacterium]|nr:alpha/beta fold hydrolase [Chitinophagaceae bacterium]